VSPALLARTVRRPYTLVGGPCDTGIVQSSSVQHDDTATVDAALDFYEGYRGRVDEEARVLRDRRIELVVGDIPPIAFDVAASLGVPAVAVANFTWDWIYETHPGFAERAPHVLDTIRRAYGRATLALELPFGAGFDVFPRVRRVPLVARRPTKSRDVTRAHFGLPTTGPVALLSFGGYGMPSLDLSAVDCLDDWTIVTTDRTRTAEATSAAIILPEGAFTDEVRYEDLVAAVDVVITKPGYGIIAECMSSDTPMLYTSRGSFREYDLLVAEMPRYLRCRFIGQDDLFGGRWRDALETLLAQPEPPEMMPLDGAEVVAEIIRDLVVPESEGPKVRLES
jgi:UDP:flavonoid glycosyltransferase YjiC (YdhE family)